MGRERRIGGEWGRMGERNERGRNKERKREIEREQGETITAAGMEGSH